jgi:hypothetical protein
MGRIALNNGLLAGLIGVAISLLGTVTGIYDMSDDFQGERGWESTIVSAISFAVLIYFFPANDLVRVIAVLIVFLGRASAIQWGLYYPRWLIFGKGK